LVSGINDTAADTGRYQSAVVAMAKYHVDRIITHSDGNQHSQQLDQSATLFTAFYNDLPRRAKQSSKKFALLSRRQTTHDVTMTERVAARDV